MTIGSHPSSRMLRFKERMAEVEVFVTVKNVGDYDGAESVLLFLQSPFVRNLNDDDNNNTNNNVGWNSRISSEDIGWI